MTPVSKYLQARGRYILGTLVVSVALNLFLLGALLGITPHAKHRSLGPLALAGPHGEYLVGWVAHYLDESDARAFRESFQGEAKDLRQAHDDVHKSVSQLASVFEQDPPDPAALKNALDQLSSSKNEVNEAVSKVMQSAYTKLSPEGRRRLSDITQNPM